MYWNEHIRGKKWETGKERDPSERKCLECPEHLKCPQGWKRKEIAEVSNDVSGRENESLHLGSILQLATCFLYELPELNTSLWTRQEGMRLWTEKRKDGDVLLGGYY